MKIALDGQKSGAYTAECECGTSWRGQTIRDSKGLGSPALPVAEAVVHMRMCHDDDTLQLVFAWHFEEWLEAYWNRLSNTSSLDKA